MNLLQKTKLTFALKESPFWFIAFAYFISTICITLLIAFALFWWKDWEEFLPNEIWIVRIIPYSVGLAVLIIGQIFLQDLIVILLSSVREPQNEVISVCALTSIVALILFYLVSQYQDDLILETAIQGQFIASAFLATQAILQNMN